MAKSSPMSLPGEGILVLPDATGEGTISYGFVPPTPEQMAIFAADASTGSLTMKMAAILNFLEDILEDPNDIHEIRRRLRSREDVLDLQKVFGPVREMFVDQSGFPTQSPSASTSSPSPTGKRSTGRVQPGE